MTDTELFHWLQGNFCELSFDGFTRGEEGELLDERWKCDAGTSHAATGEALQLIGYGPTPQDAIRACQALFEKELP